MMPLILPRALLAGSAFYPLYALVGAQELLVFGVPAVLVYLRNDVAFNSLRRQLAPSGPLESGLTMLTAVSYTLLGAVITALWAWFLARFGLLPPQKVLPDPTDAAQYAFALLCAALIPAVSEELVFRGLLLQWLRQRGEKLAAIVSALLFALMHRSLHAFPALLVIGLMLSILTLRHRGLFLPMLFHFVYNLSVVVLTAAGGAFTLPAVLLGSVIAVVSARYLLRPNKEDAHGTDHHRL